MSILILSILALATVLGLAAWRRDHIVIASNAAGTHHGGRVTRVSVGAIATRYLVVKQSGTGLGIAAAGATDHPLGIVTDEADAADEAINVIMPGSADGTVMMVAAVAIAAGDVLYTAAAGTVTNVAVAGCYIVGTALTPAAVGETVEVDPAAFGVPYASAS